MNLFNFSLILTASILCTSFSNVTMDWEYHIAQQACDSEHVSYLEKLFAQRAQLSTSMDIYDNEVPENETTQCNVNVPVGK